MTSGSGSPGVQRSVEFRAAPSRGGQARRIVAAYVRYWGLGQLAGPAGRGATELLSALPRGAADDEPCAVELSCRPGELTVSVREGDPRSATAPREAVRTLGFAVPTAVPAPAEDVSAAVPQPTAV
ncbi:hypothetical protein [Streptomyces sulphureus]|uniref:hypothetical protein n=1 Tax=Streptomyces sulphureus TaxID=47758 RepID=UPI00039C70B8|nr:hypothetical protein [Streptomyces sulphureus]